MAIQFSRQLPPLAIIPVNDNAVGARTTMIPVEYKPERTRRRRQLLPTIVEHKTVFEDNNKPRPTPLCPPYVVGNGNTEFDPSTRKEIIQGSRNANAQFPIIF